MTPQIHLTSLSARVFSIGYTIYITDGSSYSYASSYASL